MKFKIVTIFIALIFFIVLPVNISKADLASDLLKKAQDLSEKQKIKGKKLEVFILSNTITVDYEGKEQTYKFNKDITYDVYENSKVIGDGTWTIKGLTKSSIKLSGYKNIYFQIYNSKDKISTLTNLKKKSDSQTNRKILKISSLNDFEDQLANSKTKKEKKKLVKKEEEKLTEEKAAEAKKLTEKKAAEAKKLTEKKAAEAKKLLLLSPEKKLEIAQQFLENIKIFVKLYPDEFDTIKIFEFILATRPIIEGILDDKLKEDLKLFIEFTNKSKQFVKYQDEIEKNIKNGLSHKKAIAAVKKEEKKEEKKEKKIDKSDLKKITTLGYQYFDGSNGFKKDIKKSAELWKLAAEQGYAEAQYQLGISYKYGEGVKKDLAIAYMWISNSLMELYRINSKSGLKDSHRKKENMLSNDKNLLNDDRMVNEAINQLDDLYASMPSSDLIKGINLGNSCWKRKFKNCDK